MIDDCYELLLDKVMNKISTLTYHKKFELNNNRRQQILEFLSVEAWSTADNLRLLLAVNHNAYVRRLLDRMIEDGLINKHHFIVNGSKRSIYLISDFGFLELGFVGRTKPTKVSVQNYLHNELVQNLKIQATALGFSWQNELELIRSKSFASYPDGLLNIDNQLKISIELQRNRFSMEALKSKVAKCLADCLNGKFNKVLFICADNLSANTMQKALFSVENLKGKSHQDIHFSNEYKARFEFINFSGFADYLQKGI